jgi:hypothetical protein
MASISSVFVRFRGSMSDCAYQTCSLTSLVVPTESSHLPKNSSPKKGFNGFFSLPKLSLRLLYCCLRVVKNHFSTRSARLAGSCSLAGATKMAGCSVQYDEYSVNDVPERINGGAVSVEMSPEKEVILYFTCQLLSHRMAQFVGFVCLTFRNEDQLPFADAGTLAPS